MSELELKFQVPEDLVSSLKGELRKKGGRRLRLVARYYDTTDGQLARQRISLRLRKEGRRWIQTLKADGDSAVHRLQHNVPLRVAPGVEPVIDPARHDGSAAGALLSEALAAADAPGLVERFTVEVTRLACDLQASGAEIEAALDVGVIRAGERSARICELELEHKAGDLRGLFELAQVWTTHGGLWLNTLSKSARGSALAEGRDRGPPVKAAIPKLDSGMSGGALLRAILLSALDQVLANASEVASGSTAEEHVHQLRIGLRRLRTALRELAPVANGIDPAWQVPLAAAFSRLGVVRDDETVATAVRPLLEKAGAPKVVWKSARGGWDLGAIVREPDFQRTLLAVLSLALSEEVTDAGSPSSTLVLDHVTARLSKLHQQIVRSGKRFMELPAPKQHQERKRLKRLRYLAEFVQTMWAPKPVRRYLRHLGPAQDALGTHNDVAVAQEKFQADAERDARSFYAAGYLQAHLGVTAKAAHVALKEVAGARRFWVHRQRS